ncbi:hypothetical protein [Tenacibaculum sp. SG-28]|uniref:hypothetical protein n=1 Tax=Tenacibaculum sp. SG-28 TaxID=754426 RepID=UPI001304B976|nr:hypothetical protein [Tenacibaculum sp. SG-28]
MKKIIYPLICILTLASFYACGSTNPCGLAKVDTKQQKTLTPPIEIVEVTAE